MPTHLNATNLSPIRARTAPSRVSSTSFPMISGAPWWQADAVHSRRAGRQVPGPAPWLVPAPPASSALPARVAEVQVWVSQPRHALPPWLHGRLQGPGPRRPLLAGIPSCLQGCTCRRESGVQLRQEHTLRRDDRGSLLLKAAEFSLSNSNGMKGRGKAGNWVHSRKFAFREVKMSWRIDPETLDGAIREDIEAMSFNSPFSRVWGTGPYFLAFVPCLRMLNMVGAQFRLWLGGFVTVRIPIIDGIKNIRSEGKEINR